MIIPVRKLNYMDSYLDGLLWQAQKLTPAEKTVLDFKEVGFLRPECVVLMIIVSEMLFAKSEQAVEWTNLSPDEKSYLERINISQIPFLNVPKPEYKWFRSKQPSKHLIELECISDPVQLQEAAIRTRDILKEWFPGDLRGSAFYSDAAVIIMEIVNNSIEHSVRNYTEEPGRCYFTTQRFQVQNSDQPNVVIAFGDAGMGIRNSLQRTNEWVPNSDSYAIKKALFEGVTSRVDGSGGLGLKRIVELLEKYGGTITVRSGYSAVYYAPQTQQLRVKKFREFIVGTQTSIIF